jgi:general secretion pathway protein G
LAVVAAVIMPKSGHNPRARFFAAQTELTNFKTALDAFKRDIGCYPKTLDELLVQPHEVLNWRGPYLFYVAIPKEPMQSIPLDRWGNAYLYEYPGKHNTNTYDLISLGPDGRLKTEDDITN